MNILASLALFATSLMAGPAPADAKSKRPGVAHHNKGGHMCAELECSEAQREALKTLKQNLKHQLGPIKKEMKRARQALMHENAKDEPNLKTVEYMENKIAALQTERAGIVRATVIKMNAALTPAQREVFAERMEKRAERRAKRDRDGDGKPDFKAKRRGDRDRDGKRGKAKRVRAKDGERDDERRAKGARKGKRDGKRDRDGKRSFKRKGKSKRFAKHPGHGPSWRDYAGSIAAAS